MLGEQLGCLPVLLTWKTASHQDLGVTALLRQGAAYQALRSTANEQSPPLP